MAMPLLQYSLSKCADIASNHLAASGSDIGIVETSYAWQHICVLRP